MTYTYDKLGRRIGATPQLGSALAYLYDDLNRITSVQTGTRAFTYAYSGADPRVQSLIGPENGQATYEYVDPLKRLTALVNTDGSSQSINRFDYAYTDRQNPDQISSEAVTDGPGIAFTQEGLTAYQHNASEQLINESNFGSMVYDDAGNLVQGYTPGGQAFMADHDAENRLTYIQYTDGGAPIKPSFYTVPAVLSGRSRNTRTAHRSATSASSAMVCWPFRSATEPTRWFGNTLGAPIWVEVLADCSIYARVLWIIHTITIEKVMCLQFWIRTPPMLVTLR